MGSCLTRFVGELLAIAAYGDQERVYGHGAVIWFSTKELDILASSLRILESIRYISMFTELGTHYSDLPAELVFDLARLYSLGAVLLNQLEQVYRRQNFTIARPGDYSRLIPILPIAATRRSCVLRRKVLLASR